MYQWSGYQKVCATCANWSGCREIPRYTPGCVGVESLGVKGSCYCRDAQESRSSGDNCQSNHTCSHWTKWGAIR